MTNEYKENILKYVTGNLPNQTGINEPDFTTDTITNNLYTSLFTYFNTIARFGVYISSKDNSNLNYSILGVYGEVKSTGETGNGLVILDEDNNIVQVITEWSDGTPIKEIQALSIDETDGTFYGVENIGTGLRIVELNNIVLKLESQSQFSATVINSYSIPTQYSIQRIRAIKRSEDKQKYFLIGELTSGLIGCHFEKTNTWTYYTSTKIWNTFGFWDNINQCYNVYWDSNGNVQFQMIGIDNNNAGSFYLLSKGTGSTMNVQSIYSTQLTVWWSMFSFLTNEIGYLALTLKDDDTNESVFQILKINFTTNEITQNYYDSYAYDNSNIIYVFKNNNNMYFCEIIDTDGTGQNNDVTFGLIVNDTIYTEILGDFASTNFQFTMCYPNVINQYNHNKIYLQSQEKLFTVDFDWNELNYNGQSFINTQSLIPAKATILDSNNKEIYNRNLYNLTNFSNRYTASTQISNSTLNGMELYTTNLLSINNNILVNKTIDLEKNVYEEMYLNFVNQINITNDINDENNVTAASRLVNSMLNNDYQNTFISKYKINYNDETNSIKTIGYNDLTYTNNTTTYNLIVYVDKKINNIQLISNDENTAYYSIDCSNLEIGKYYKISQDLSIE